MSGLVSGGHLRKRASQVGARVRTTVKNGVPLSLFPADLGDLCCLRVGGCFFGEEEEDEEEDEGWCLLVLVPLWRGLDLWLRVLPSVVSTAGTTTSSSAAVRSKSKLERICDNTLSTYVLYMLLTMLCVTSLVLHQHSVYDPSLQLWEVRV